MSNSKNLQEDLVSPTERLAAVCSEYSLFKTDEELCDSFESFFVPKQSLKDAAGTTLQSTFEAIHDLLPIFHELGHVLVAGENHGGFVTSEQTDPSNRLNASLKRHPE